MTTLHVLLPASRLQAGSPLTAWLAHGNRLPDVENARDTALRGLFHVAGDQLPVAALRHVCHTEHASGEWLAADPAYVQTEATGARLFAWPLGDLSGMEAEALARSLRPLLGDAGAPLEIDTPSAWCVPLAAGVPKAVFVAPQQALGASLIDCLPAGAGGRKWRRLFTEVQVLLHAHPVNAARAAAGKQPVNALWFWGEGAVPAGADTRLGKVVSGSDVVRGLARIAGVPWSALAPAALDGIPESRDALLDLGDSGAPGLEAWLPAFRQVLRARRFDVLELTFASGERFSVRHVHRLRFWRRA